MWQTPEEKLKLIRPKAYHAPTGFFDDVAESRPAPAPLLEDRDAWLRMEVFRKVLAALVAQHVFLCICALVGIQMHMMQIEPPVYAKPVTAGVAVVTYFIMYLKATRYSLNLYLFVIFTLSLGVYLVVSVAGNGHHYLANLIFQFTLGWVLQLLYSLPSFCCNLSAFDIKYGWIGYLLMTLSASCIGVLAAHHMSPGPIMHAALPVFGGAVYNVFSLYNVYQALGYFYEDFKMAIIIYPWVGLLDWALRYFQAIDRFYIHPLSN